MKNAMTIYGRSSEGRSSLRRGAGRFCDMTETVIGISSSRRLSLSSAATLTGCGEAQFSGTSIAHRSDLTSVCYSTPRRWLSFNTGVAVLRSVPVPVNPVAVQSPATTSGAASTGEVREGTPVANGYNSRSGRNLFPAECQRRRDNAHIKPAAVILTTTDSLSSRVSDGGRN